jgi:hypothetical protein
MNRFDRINAHAVMRGAVPGDQVYAPPGVTGESSVIGG